VTISEVQVENRFGRVGDIIESYLTSTQP